MRLRWIVTLNFLVLGFVLTIFAIYMVQTRGLPAPILNVFGIDAGKRSSTYRQSWCDTRVSALIRPNEFKLEQEGMKWIGDDGEPRELNFIAVEKWFGRNCAVRAQVAESPISLEEKSEFIPALFVKFITGEVTSLRRSADGRYIWRDRVFRSPKLDQALGELEELVPLKKEPTANQ